MKFEAFHKCITFMTSILTSAGLLKGFFTLTIWVFSSIPQSTVMKLFPPPQQLH